jgi:hypothetical protein
VSKQPAFFDKHLGHENGLLCKVDFVGSLHLLVILSLLFLAEFVGVTGGEAMRVDVPVSLKYVLQHFVSFQHVVHIWNIIYAVAADEGRN